MSILILLETGLYWELPREVGKSFHDLLLLKPATLRQNPNIQEAEITNFYNEVFEKIRENRYDFQTNAWYAGVRHELYPYCRKLLEMGFQFYPNNPNNSIIAEHAAYFFICVGTQGDGLSTVIASSNMAGTGQRDQENITEINIKYFESQGGFYGKTNKTIPHHKKAFAPEPPTLTFPTINKYAQDGESDFASLLKINYYEKNPNEFRKEFINEYKKSVSVYRVIYNSVTLNTNSWKNNPNFRISDVLEHARQKPYSSSAMALNKLRIRNINLNPLSEDIIRKEQKTYQDAVKNYEKNINTYLQTLANWKKEVPKHWIPILIERGQWPDESIYQEKLNCYF